MDSPNLITLAVIAVNDDDAILIGLKDLANYIGHGFPCIAQVKDADGKLHPLAVDVLAVEVKTDESMMAMEGAGSVEGVAKSALSLYRITGAHGLVPLQIGSEEFPTKDDIHVLAVGHAPDQKSLAGDGEIDGATQTLSSNDGNSGIGFETLAAKNNIPNALAISRLGQLVGLEGANIQIASHLYGMGGFGGESSGYAQPMTGPGYSGSGPIGKRDVKHVYYGPSILRAAIAATIDQVENAELKAHLNRQLQSDSKSDQ